MAEDFDPVITPEDGQAKSRTWVIVAVIVVILLCCCCFSAMGVSWLWNNGDQLINELSMAFQVTNLFM